MMKRLLINAIKEEKAKKEAEVKRMRDEALAKANPGRKLKKKRTSIVKSQDEQVDEEEERKLGEEADRRKNELMKSLNDQDDGSKDSKEADMDAMFELEPPPPFRHVGVKDLHLEKIDPRVASQPLEIFKPAEDLGAKVGVKYRENDKVTHGGDYIEKKMRETGRLTREAYFFKAATTRKVGPESRNHLQTQ